MIEENVLVFLKKISEVLNHSKLAISDTTLDSLKGYIMSLPDDITNSDIFIMAESICPATKYEEVQWIFSEDISYIDTHNPEKYIKKYFKASSDLRKYIKKIVIDDSIGERESIVVILSLFESFLHSKVAFDDKKGIKTGFCNAVTKVGNYSAETIALAVTYAIVKIVYANTSNSEGFDKRLPHRNDILHNGTLSYSDDDIKVAYTMLLSFICIIDDMI